MLGILPSANVTPNKKKIKNPITENIPRMLNVINLSNRKTVVVFFGETLSLKK